MVCFLLPENENNSGTSVFFLPVSSKDAPKLRAMLLSTSWGSKFPFCPQIIFGEKWSVNEEKEGGRFRKDRERETGLLLKKHHWEIFLKIVYLL